VKTEVRLKLHGKCVLYLVEVKVKVKVKSYLCFNWASRHGGVLWAWRYSSTHSWPWH